MCTGANEAAFMAGDAPTDLTGFQRDLFTEAVRLNNVRQAAPPNGFAIRDRIIDEYEAVSRGRLYPNLDILAEKGLLNKEPDPDDDRANLYEITRRGQREIYAHAKYICSALPTDARQALIRELSSDFDSNSEVGTETEIEVVEEGEEA